MSNPTVVLDELERDALTELVNIGVSRAAVSLRTMVGQQVCSLCRRSKSSSRPTAAVLIRERETDSLVVVRQDFTGAFSGQALLIFPETNSLELVRAVTGEPGVRRRSGTGWRTRRWRRRRMSCSSGCLATLANMLERPLDMSLPAGHARRGGQAFRTRSRATGPRRWCCSSTSTSRSTTATSAATSPCCSTFRRCEALRSLIRDFISRIVGEEVPLRHESSPAPDAGRSPTLQLARRRLDLGRRSPTCCCADARFASLTGLDPDRGRRRSAGRAILSRHCSRRSAAGEDRRRGSDARGGVVRKDLPCSRRGGRGSLGERPRPRRERRFGQRVRASAANWSMSPS